MIAAERTVCDCHGLGTGPIQLFVSDGFRLQSRAGRAGGCPISRAPLSRRALQVPALLQNFAQCLLYPDCARHLQTTLDTSTELRSLHESLTARRPPESEEGFLRWVIERPDEKKLPPEASPSQPLPEARLNVSADARRLARQFVLMARSEALAAPGEGDAGLCLLENWLRSEPDWGS